MCSGLARRPLKAVARVRIPSGLPRQNDLRPGATPAAGSRRPQAQSPKEGTRGASVAAKECVQAVDSLGGAILHCRLPGNIRVGAISAPGSPAGHPSAPRSLTQPRALIADVTSSRAYRGHDHRQCGVSRFRARQAGTLFASHHLGVPRLSLVKCAPGCGRLR